MRKSLDDVISRDLMIFVSCDRAMMKICEFLSDSN